MEATQVNVMHRIGDKAPAFTAKTTQGTINFPSDYKGKWKILFSPGRLHSSVYLGIHDLCHHGSRL